MIDLDAFDTLRFLESEDLLSGFDFPGIARGNKDDGRRSFGPPFQFSGRQPVFGNVDKDVQQVRLQSRQNHLSLGITKPDVIFEQFWSLRREHKTCVQNTAVRFRSFESGLDDSTQYSVLLSLGENRVDGVRAHAAGIWARVGIEAPFVILRRSHRLEIPAISKHVEGCFLAFEKFLDHQSRPRFSKSPRFHKLLNRAARINRVFRDHNSFSGSQAIGLDHDRVFGTFQNVVCLSQR